MWKTRLVALGSLIVAILFLFFFDRITQSLNTLIQDGDHLALSPHDLCYSPEKKLRFLPATPIFSPDGTQISFLAYTLVYQNTVGICTFPNGGIPMLIRNEIRVYTTNGSLQNMPSLKAIISLPTVSSRILDHRHYKILGWEGNHLYLWIYYPPTPSGKKLYYDVDLGNGAYDILPQQKGQELESLYWGQAQFNPTNETQWIDYDTNTNSIGIYTGGHWQMDKVKKSLIQSKLLPATFVETIVDNNTMKALRPTVD